MIKVIVSDFSRVLLFPKEGSYKDGLNALHKELSEKSDYSPLDYFEFNQPLLDLYQSLKAKYPLYIFTSDAIQDAPEFQQYLKPIFEDILSAKKMNTDKKTSDAYTLVAKQIGVDPQEILYIDDTPANIQAAKTAGLSTFLYSDFEKLRTHISEALNT